MATKTVMVYAENNDLQYIDTLRRNRGKRHRHRTFFVEGVRPITQAVAHVWTIEAFVYARASLRLGDGDAGSGTCRHAL